MAVRVSRPRVRRSWDDDKPSVKTYHDATSWNTSNGELHLVKDYTCIVSYAAGEWTRVELVDSKRNPRTRGRNNV